MAAEVAVIAPALLILMLLVVYAGHVAEADGDVRRAASEAARAASLRQHPDAAIDAARETATANLAAAGIVCDPLTVDVDTDNFVPGGTVTVEVTCVATLDAVTLLRVARDRSYYARSVEVIDTFRSTVT
ncbi:MAG TPA: TadE/TadG family type IV pilus assembly protein [Ilumatobacter sp.]|nr:TadE/TadG family type IV pilus assembly protein [Ilumatobacter sp.]